MNRIDTFGEVMTPKPLALQMLASIPLDFWKNPSIKILENSCGKGIFLTLIYDIFIQYHSREHILNNMLYACDIQQDNVDKTKSKLPLKHIECVDALNFDYWEEQFNLVIGNPPYNKPKKDKKGNNCNPLWITFTELAVNKLVKEDGYLLYVHPPLYRKIGHKLWNLMNSKHFQEIHMFSMEKSSELFKAKTKVDWYLWKNTSIKTDTTIVDERNYICCLNLIDKAFLPNHSLDDVYKVFSGECEVIYNCAYHHYTHKDYMSEVKTDTHIYPCVYLINNRGVEYYWSSRNDRGHFGIKKVIMSMGTGKAILDYSGEFGMCEISFGIPISNKEEGEKLIAYFASESFKNILSAVKWKTVQIDYKLFRKLNKNLLPSM
jgi:hypothetical protein